MSNWHARKGLRQQLALRQKTRGHCTAAMVNKTTSRHRQGCIRRPCPGSSCTSPPRPSGSLRPQLSSSVWTTAPESPSTEPPRAWTAGVRCGSKRRRSRAKGGPASQGTAASHRGPRTSENDNRRRRGRMRPPHAQAVPAHAPVFVAGSSTRTRQVRGRLSLGRALAGAPKLVAQPRCRAPVRS